MTNKIAEIRARHLRLEDMRSSTPDETYFGAWAAHHDRATLLAENDRLRETLRWYADPRNHSPIERRYPGASVVFLEQPIMSDGGRRARRALNRNP